MAGRWKSLETAIRIYVEMADAWKIEIPHRRAVCYLNFELSVGRQRRLAYHGFEVRIRHEQRRFLVCKETDVGVVAVNRVSVHLTQPIKRDPFAMELRVAQVESYAVSRLDERLTARKAG